ncbi:FAD-binding domain-containing protein [Patellaria atrata CBS 101060]|uniref:FAD-binding domain-containing protein n=1 Tax=Patellaria atrata CBS 101060 TaxID=1346257 RepID=A0A9P4VS05_9PEZI|nr:FAD-binding domain-containing protein [Patellaria atrata CBS 101060]
MWDAKQAEIIPACRVEPASAEEITFILKTVIEHQCNFAIKGGGHARHAGSSNADNGVTIDLAKMNQVEIASDRKTVKVGGGAVWLDVYTAVEAEGLMVIGGRVGDVGVGGLTLGGGISFFSGRHGWACDSVIAFEIVLPDGTFTKITQSSNPDLFWALRGGSNNFGVVIAFHFETFEHPGKLWRATRLHKWEDVPELLDMQYDFQVNQQPKDLDTGTFFPYGYYAAYDMMLVPFTLVHTAHDDIDNPPEAFKKFFTKDVMDGSKVDYNSLSNITLDIQQSSPPGLRVMYKTVTYRASRELDGKILDLYLEALEHVKKIPGIIPVVVFHPVAAEVFKKMQKNGGNPLGLDDVDGPVTVMQIAWAWTNKEDDELNYKVTKRLFENIKVEGDKLGVMHRYIYQNYAWADQDVFSGYGEENLARLRKIQKSVDPNGAFAAGGLNGGYFKVNKVMGSVEGMLRDEL